MQHEYITKRPSRKDATKKKTTTLPVVAQKRCSFRTNIYYHKSNGYYYLSTNGNVHNFQKGFICSHHHHERQTVVLSSRIDTDENVEKMVKQFAMTNLSPSTDIMSFICASVINHDITKVMGH
jgi:hypothetical protein